jgi:hypothetical protein
MFYRVVVESANVSDFAQRPVRSGSLARIVCRSRIATCAWDTGAANVVKASGAAPSGIRGAGSAAAATGWARATAPLTSRPGATGSGSDTVSAVSPAVEKPELLRRHVSKREFRMASQALGRT